MIKITYIEHIGKETVIELLNGKSIMEGALENNISGIDADCGGSCSCATCHVHIDPVWMSRLPEASPMENDILSFATGVNENSRLSCQLKASPDIDGLIVHVPKENSV